MSLKVISKSGCPYCLKLKDLLKEKDLEFEEVVLDDNDERQAFYRKWEVNTVPQLFQNGIRIGGYTEILPKIGEIVVNENNNSMQHSTVYKPFYAPWAVDIAKRHEKIHWIEEEADLSEDVNQWKNGKLSNEEKAFITDILRLFTQSDVIVGQNYYEFLIPKFKNNEIRNMLGSFSAREAIHQRAYALLTDTLGLPDSEYSAFREYESMKNKADYMLKNDNSSLKGLGLCLAKSVFSEGVLLFASFAMLLNFQRFGKMKGVGKIVEWSQRDEAVTPETEVMLEDGTYKKIKDIKIGEKILEFDINTQELSFKEVEIIKEVIRDEMYIFESDNFYQEVSPNHRMIFMENGEIKECLAKDFEPSEEKYLIVLED